MIGPRMFTWNQRLLTLYRLGIISLLAMISAGCVAPKVRPNDPHYSPVTTASLTPPPQTNGGIYQEGFGVRLYDDKRAKRAGDILTVILQESTTSSKTSSTSIDKNSSVDSPAPTLFGTSPSIDPKGFIPSSSSLSMENNIESDREFEGESEADQSNSLQGSITVTVADVLPNGVLVIRGEKWLTLTQGEEFIRISGMVRPEDIRPDNTVPSTKIADARIAYSGTGDLADANQQGWLSRFFNSKWYPF